MFNRWRKVAMVLLLATAAVAEPPNVVVLVADDVGYGDLSCYGNPYVNTPHLDALKGGGVSLDRFMVSPTGAASRAAALTGRHEFAVGVSHTRGGRSLLRPDSDTIAEVFSNAGFATGIFGKWHLGDAFPCRPEDQGFEKVWVHGGAGLGSLGDAWGNGEASPLMRTREGWMRAEGKSLEATTEAALSWMESQAKKPAPFFLWLAFDAPRVNSVAEGEEPSSASEAGEDDTLPVPVKRFYRFVEDMDSRIGRIVEKIDQLDLAEETLICFLSDNGSVMPVFDAGMKGGRGSPHEGGVRVPCFLRWRGRIESGGEVEALASHVDLFPTLTALAGVELPEAWTGDGVDLSAALLGEASFPRGRVFFTHVGGWSGDDSPQRHRARNFSIRSDLWRMVGLALYDLRVDPRQEENVFAEFQEEGARLLADYGRWWDSVLPSLRRPVRYVVGDPAQRRVELTAFDWWPSLEGSSGGAPTIWRQDQLRRYLDRARVAKTRNELPGVVGHWKLSASTAGSYRVQMSLIPPGAPAEDRRSLGKL
ncbi:MAG: sulfatase-like hydrolase/transferase, partial [Verrucomicrobiales bacterium]